MAHQIALENEKFKQWVKAVLGLKYVQEGLAPFCDDISKQQQQDILDKIKRDKQVSSVICYKCDLKTLQPDHVCLENKQCPLGHVTCNCCYASGKTPCPNNVCGAIYDNIITNHASTPPMPNWKNTRTHQWIANHWSIAKCFINGPGYQQATSAAGTYCVELLQLIINNKYFHNHVSLDMTVPNLFSKVRQYRDEILYSSPLRLDSQQTNSYIDAMIAILQDGKELMHRQDAQEAVKKLQDLKNNDLCITTKEEGNIMRNVTDELMSYDAECAQVEKVESSVIDGDTLRSLLEGVEAINSEREQREAELAKEVVTLQKEMTYTEKNVADLSIGSKQNIGGAFKGVLKTKEDNFEDKSGFEAEWITCLNNKDEEKAYQLLEQGHLPDAALLNKACQILGLKSALLKIICTRIEERITASSDCIIYTDACYKGTEKDKIVFVVITREAADHVYLSKEKYNLLVRSIDDCSQEGGKVVAKEKDFQFEESELKALDGVLKDNSPGLMEKHSNLTLTSGSLFKSKYKGLKELSIERKVCIVLYVTVKELIPVGEDLLPNKLGTFDTDVREGRFYFAVGGQPGAKHNNLKIGCRISCIAGAGTIGGFVKHPKHGECALTCAHVVLSKKEALDLVKKGNDNCRIGNHRECFQPNNNKDDVCGKVVEVQIIEGDQFKIGVDAALVKIKDDRLPTNGTFPDCHASRCSHCNDDSVSKISKFENGKVLIADKIKPNKKIIKYGQKTKFTIGKLHVTGGSGRLEWPEERYSNFTLHGLITITGVDCPFSDSGDSGALVFSQDDKNELAAIGLLVGANITKQSSPFTLVQPICSVLEHLGLKTPFSLMKFDPQEPRKDELE